MGQLGIVIVSDSIMWPFPFLRQKKLISKPMSTLLTKKPLWTYIQKGHSYS